MKPRDGDKGICRHCHEEITFDGDPDDDGAWGAGGARLYDCEGQGIPPIEAWHEPMVEKFTASDRDALLQLEEELRITKLEEV